MSLNYTGLNSYPSIRVVTINTLNTEINLPSSSKRVTITDIKTDMYLAFDGDDAGAPVANKIKLEQGQSMEFKIAKGKNRARNLYIASLAGSGSIALIFEEE